MSFGSLQDLGKTCYLNKVLLSSWSTSVSALCTLGYLVSKRCQVHVYNTWCMPAIFVPFHFLFVYMNWWWPVLLPFHLSLEIMKIICLSLVTGSTRCADRCRFFWSYSISFYWSTLKKLELGSLLTIWSRRLAMLILTFLGFIDYYINVFLSYYYKKRQR